MTDVSAVIIAGGQSSRMTTGNKALQLLAGKPLIVHVRERLSPAIKQLFVNTRSAEVSACLADVPVIADREAGYRGPLMGLLSVLAANEFTNEYLLLVPCDTPFIPTDLADVLLAAIIAEQADVAVVSYGGELQPTFSLWHRRCYTAVAATVERHLGGFKDVLDQLKVVVVDWPVTALDPFFNINTPADLAEAQRLIRDEY